MKKVLSTLLALCMCMSLCFLLISCNNGKSGTNTEITEKEFIVGEEILFENGEEFYLPFNTFVWGEGTTTEQCKITAKMIAMEEYTLDNPSNWPYREYYLFSYRYRIYVKGYCSKEHAGEQINHTLKFRTSPYNGVQYNPVANYESTTIDENGYFEFSVDVYMPDVVTKVIPLEIHSID